VEFALITSAKVLKHRVERDGSNAEHTAIMDDADIVVEGDRAGWKYVWAAEHHFLTEYSHMSASEAFLGYVAAKTSRIHLGSGIFNLNPVVNHPVRIAERVAMLDHLSDGRFEFGTGRGAGSLEVTGFGIPDAGDTTRAAWDEVIREFIPMWEGTAYSHKTELFQVPHADSEWPTRNVLPKVWRKPHPPLWVACGNPATYEKSARLGLGALGFSFNSPQKMAPMIDLYKRTIRSAEPIGRFVNDNVLLVSLAVCLEDSGRAREALARSDAPQMRTLSTRYHDTFHRELAAAPVPSEEMTEEDIDAGIRNSTLICGDPDEVLSQLQVFVEVGCDQIGFLLPLSLDMEDAKETVQLIGKYVIPKLDTDPRHRTDIFRSGAAA
jgi:alkanesulfonate monooxygenase SsuD/methylene tetrahydromethanopterin reductase-like flavin-dependent oxidoreductase (luciferase family)